MSSDGNREIEQDNLSEKSEDSEELVFPSKWFYNIF